MSGDLRDREKAFAHGLRVRRCKLGMTQADVAVALTELGIMFDNAVISRVEAGARKVSWVEAEALAGILGSTPAEIAGDDALPTPAHYFQLRADLQALLDAYPEDAEWVLP